MNPQESHRTGVARHQESARRGATFTLGLRAYSYLALAQYLAGAWDDVLLTVEQGFSAAAIHARRYEMPLLHLAATCVPRKACGMAKVGVPPISKPVCCSIG